MRKVLVTLLLGIILWGCEEEKTTLEKKNTPQFTSEKIKTVGKGEPCGGPERIKCKNGLECSDKNPTKMGVCLPLPEGEIQCPEIKSPVCGLRGNNKNGYLNECEAKRHGAKVISKGFCKPDKSVIGNCDASAFSIGNCDAWFEGAYFDKKSHTCKKIGVSGCSADIPFKTLEECRIACEKTKKSSEEE